MAKQTYLGPGAECRMKLKRAYMDLSDEIGRCRPLGPEFMALTDACDQLATTYLVLFGEPIRPVNMMGARV